MASPIQQLSAQNFIEDQGLAKPLSKEAREIRAPLASDRSMLDAVFGEMKQMEKSDARKLQLYKIAIIIITVISLAILAAAPIVIFMGGAVWIPIVVSLIGYTLCSLSISALRQACSRIEAKYRSLAAYRQQLSNQNSSYHKTRSAKYKYFFSGPETGKHLLAKIRSGLDSTENQKESLCEYLDLAGGTYLRLQCESDVGIDSSESPWLYKCLLSVHKAKQGMFTNTKDGSVSEQLDRIASKELKQADARMLSSSDLLSLANSLKSLCGFGCKVGRNAQQSIRHFDRLYANSVNWISTSNIAEGTKLFCTQGHKVIDQAEHLFNDLTRFIDKLQQGMWATDIIKWVNRVEKTTSLDAHQIECLCEQGFALCVHEGAQPEGKALIKCLMRTLELLQNGGASTSSDHEVTHQIAALKTYYQNLCRSLHISPTASPELIVQALSKELASYLNSLGDLQGLRDQLHAAIRLAQYARTNIDACIADHPEKMSARLHCDLEKATQILARDSWGADSSCSVEVIIQEKDQLTAKINQLTAQIHQWEREYRTFYSQELRKLLLADFAKLHVDLESRIEKFYDTCLNAQELDAFIEQTKRDLDVAVQQQQSSFLPQEEVQCILSSYLALLSKLHLLQKEINTLSDKVHAEAATPFSTVLQSLSKSEAKITAQKELKKEALTAFYQAQRQEVRGSSSQYSEAALLQFGVQHFSQLLTNIEELDLVLKNLDNLSIQSVEHAFSSLFSSLNQNQLGSLNHLEEHLQLLINQQLGEPSVEGLDSAVENQELGIADSSIALEATSKKNSNYFTSRLRDLNRLLQSVKASTRSWRLGSSIVTMLISLVLIILGILFVSSEIVWLPVVLWAFAILSDLTALGLQHFVNKKASEEQKIILAQQMATGASGWTQTDFSNESIQHFARMQNILHLEGGELFLANEAISELKNPFQKRTPDSLKSLKQQFKKDSSKLNKRIRKRFGHDLSDQQKLSNVRPEQGGAAIHSLSSDPLARIDRTESFVLHHSLVYQTELCRWQREQSYNKILEQQVKSGEQQATHWQSEAIQLANQLKVIQQVIENQEQDLSSSQDASQSVDQIMNYMKVLFHPEADRNEKNAIKQLLHDLFHSESSQLLGIYRWLELKMCSSASALSHNQELLSQSTSIKNRIHSPANSAVEQEAKEHLLEIMNLPEYKPFVSLVHKKDELTRVLQDLQALKVQYELEGSLEEIPISQVQSILSRLSKYMKTIQALTPFAFNLLQGEEGKENTPKAMMHQLTELNRTLILNTSSSEQYLARRAVQQLENWGKSQLTQAPYDTLLQALLQFAQETDPQAQLSAKQELLEQLKSTPPFLLHCLMKDLQSQMSLCIYKYQKHLNTIRRYEASEELVQSKQTFLADNQDVLQNQREQIQQLLQELEEERQKLQNIDQE